MWSQNPGNAKLRAIGFARVSTDEQAADGRAGLPSQWEAIRLASDRWNVEIVKQVEIIDVSGSQVIESSEFRAMLEDLKSPSVDGIVVAAIDRLMRPNDFSSFAIYDVFLRHKKLIWLPGTQIDVAEDSGFMEALISSLMAGLDRRKIVRMTQMGKEANRKRGRCANSKITLPRGVDFDFQKGTWQYVEPWASRIKRAFEMLLAGNSIRSIAKTIGGYTDRGLAVALNNPIWIGVREYRYRRGEKYPSKNGRQADRRKVLRSEPLRIEINLEALISKEQFYRAQEILAGIRYGWTSSRSKESRFESAGLLYCDRCGEKMYLRGDKRRGKHDFYYCRSQFPKGRGCGAPKLWRDQVDFTVSSFVSENFIDPKIVSALIDSAARKTDVTRIVADIDRARQEISRVEKEKKRLLSLAVQGLFSEPEIQAEARRIDTELQAWTAVLRRSEREHAVCIVENSKAIAVSVASVFAEFQFLQAAERRRIMKALLPKVYINNGAITKVMLRLPRMVDKMQIRTGTD